MKLKVTILVLVAVIAAGCHSGGNRRVRPTVDPALLNLTKEEAFSRGETALEKKRWQRARTYFQHVYENFPNDPLGRRSLLKVADSYFRQGDPVNLVEAQYKYRDFLNRYPGSESADYAMFQIANVSYKQMERPDRDQVKTKEAIQKFQEMLAAYPGSTLKSEAETKMKEAYNRLAKHEHIVARFYMRRKSWEAAVNRLNALVDTYPSYTARDETFLDLGNSLAQLGRKGEARLYYERVVSEFPESPSAAEAKQKLQGMSS